MMETFRIQPRPISKEQAARLEESAREMGAEIGARS